MFSAVEASALRAPAVHRRSLAAPLLRLRSDEQLVALFRAGSEEAFAVIHDRYRQRLFGYVRQMLSAGARADAEDVLQDVFVRAYGALRNDDRDLNLRAWLYRVAHNRCIDQLRRPTPAAGDIFDVSRTPLQDPIETAQRRDDLRRLVDDVGRLPEQQRSALLMREIDGLAYSDIALALNVTVPAVKSLLVRARTGLVEATIARDTDCSVIQADLVDSYERGVKASARARRHLRECSGCREYRTTLKSMRRSFAALSPVVGFAPLALAAKALGLGGAGGGGAAASIGGTSAVTTTVASATACKVAAVVCTAALTAGTAAEVRHLTDKPAGKDKPKAAKVAPPARTASASAPTVPRSTARPYRVPVTPVAATAPAAALDEDKALATDETDPFMADEVVADTSAETTTVTDAVVTDEETGAATDGTETPEEATAVDEPVAPSSSPQPTVTIAPTEPVPAATAPPDAGVPAATPAPPGH